LSGSRAGVLAEGPTGGAISFPLTAPRGHRAQDSQGEKDNRKEDEGFACL
jgi:hypothetical protein